ncbi:CCHC-type zinc finger transcription factor [Phycomyces blakesleeanus]|uniref:CCHC-type zinc finger transcription factor n=1 Tax=Phycomyces blakesleeanus TaxID=4837 RepID=A0ABR3B9G9_PHYBL
MIIEYGPPRGYSTRSVERVIGEYSKAIKSKLAIGTNAGNIILGLAWTRQIGSLAKQNTEQPKSWVLSDDDSLAGWPLTEGGERVGAKSDIEFWGPLRCRLIDESFEGISCLPILIQAFYKSKGVECSRIEPVMTTSCKAFVNGCVIASSFAQTLLREAHHVCLQVQIDLFLQVYSVEEYNGVLVAKNGQMKPKVVHLADVKELDGLVVSDATSSTTTTTTKYIVWPELNHEQKLNLGEHLINGHTDNSPTITTPTPGLPLTYLTALTNTAPTFCHAISFLPGEIFGLNPSNKAGTLFELHLSSKDVCAHACRVGFWYNNETVLASPAIASSSKLFKLTLSKLPQFPPQEYATLDTKLHNALMKYGYVHDISINTFGFMDGSGHAYVKRPLYEEETRSCYGCHQVGHLRSKCPRAAEVDNSYKRDCKVPEPHGPHRTTATCNTTNRPTVTHSGSHMKKTLPPSFTTANPYALLDPSLSSAGSQHNPANTTKAVPTDSRTKSPKTPPLPFEANLVDRETLPADDPTLTNCCGG